MKAILHSQIQLIIYLIYDFVAALLFKHMSCMTSHVKVAPGHIIGSEIRKQDGITVSNCLNAGKEGKEGGSGRKVTSVQAVGLAFRQAPPPLSLAVNKSSSVYIFVRALDDC